MTRRNRGKFTDEFKAETVKLIRENGRTVGSVAREQNLTETAVRSLIAGVFVLATACLAIGCALPGRAPGVRRTPLEQMLLSQAVERSAESAILGLPEGTSVVLDSSAGPAVLPGRSVPKGVVGRTQGGGGAQVSMRERVCLLSSGGCRAYSP